jgi:hypothetical protein
MKVPILHAPPHQGKSLENLIMTSQVKRESLEQRVAYIETWSKWVFGASGVSLAGILAFAFWLGTISTKVSNAEQTISKVYGAVSENPSSVLVRTSLVEHRLGNIEDRLTSVEARICAALVDCDRKLSLLL